MFKSKHKYRQFNKPKSKTIPILVGILLLFVIIRVSLSGIISWYAQKQFDTIEGFNGEVGYLDMNLYRGAFSLKGIAFRKDNVDVNKPLIQVEQLESTISWEELFKGNFVSEIIIRKPKINYIQSRTPAKSQTPANQPWTKTVENLVPFRINSLKVHDGEIHIYDSSKSPPVYLSFTKINLTANNLSNTKGAEATINLSTIVQNQAQLNVKGTLLPLSQPMDFNLEGNMENLQLNLLNSFFEAYANVDVNKGTLRMIANIKAKNGYVTGFVEPIFNHVEIFSIEEGGKGKENIFKKFWEGIVGTTSEILENDEDQVAARIPIKGTTIKPQTDPLTVIGSVLNNAFIQSIVPPQIAK